MCWRLFEVFTSARAGEKVGGLQRYRNKSRKAANVTARKVKEGSFVQCVKTVLQPGSFVNEAEQDEDCYKVRTRAQGNRILRS